MKIVAFVIVTILILLKTSADCPEKNCGLSCTESCLQSGCKICQQLNCGECQSCKQGFWLSGSICEQCPLNCTSCTNASQCDSCHNGFWGSDCSKKCSNCKDGLCAQSTGECTSGCAIGHSGALCDQDCKVNHPSHCAIVGACSQYYPTLCEDNHCSKEFDPSTNCSCSINCINSTCHVEEGTCTCKPTYYGSESCHSCPPKCSTNCDSLSGYCPYCDTRDWGLFCERNCTGCAGDGGCDDRMGQCWECAERKWGQQCQTTCNDTCKENCNIRNGNCIACVDSGKWGNYCEKKCSGGCKEGCNITSGHCMECNDGLWGDICELSCWNCDEGAGYTCDRKNGDCIANPTPDPASQNKTSKITIAIIIPTSVAFALLILAYIFWDRPQDIIKTPNPAMGAGGNEEDNNYSLLPNAK